MTTASPDDPITHQLLRQAEAIAQLRREVERLAQETTDAVADLILRIEDAENTATTPSDRSAAGWCWRDIGDETEATLWEELRDWTGWIRHRYPLARRIPGCWDQHPEVVEELTALWLAWQAAYVEPDAPLTAPAEWHDRWLPGVLHRLEHGAFAIDCSTQHRIRPQSVYAAGNPGRVRGPDSAPPATVRSRGRKSKGS